MVSKSPLPNHYSVSTVPASTSRFVGYALLQRYVLWLLYHATGGESWSNSAANGWIPETHKGADVCNLADVECSGSGVATLYLENDFLRGFLPTELGFLTTLTYLDVDGSGLTTIPTELGRLSNLYFLSMRSSGLSGTIPSELGLLTNLDYLFLDSNSLTGTIPTELAQATDLFRVFLHNTRLTGQVPSAFCSSPFPVWTADDGGLDNTLFWADCLSEVQCSCCDNCF